MSRCFSISSDAINLEQTGQWKPGKKTQRQEHEDPDVPNRSHNVLLICTQERAWGSLHELDLTQPYMTSHLHALASSLSAVNNLLQSAYLIRQSLCVIAHY